MKKGCKRVISQILAGTMLLSTAFSNVLNISAEELAQAVQAEIENAASTKAVVEVNDDVIDLDEDANTSGGAADLVYYTYNFNNKTEGHGSSTLDVCIGTDGEEYMVDAGTYKLAEGAKVGEGKAYGATTSTTGSLHAYFTEKGSDDGKYKPLDGKSIRVYDDDAGSPKLTFKFDKIESTGKVSFDYMMEAVGGKMGLIGFNDSTGKRIATIRTSGDVANDAVGGTLSAIPTKNGFHLAYPSMNESTNKSNSIYTAASADANAITAGTWYNLEANFDVSAKTCELKISKYDASGSKTEVETIKGTVSPDVTDIAQVEFNGSGNTSRNYWIDNVSVPLANGSTDNDGTETPVETTTNKAVEDDTESTTDPVTETTTNKTPGGDDDKESTTDPVTETTTNNGGGSENPPKPSGHEQEWDLSDAMVGGTVDKKATGANGEIYLNSGEEGAREPAKNDKGTATYVDLGNGKKGIKLVGVDGTGKLFANFDKSYSSGKLTFSVDVQLDNPANDCGIFEFWGTDAAGKVSEKVAVRTNSGVYQVNNADGTGKVATTKATDGETHKVALTLDLDNGEITLAIDGEEVKSAAKADAAFGSCKGITDVNAVAFFFKQEGTYTYTISDLALDYTASSEVPVETTTNSQGGDDNPTESTTKPAQSSGALKTDVYKVNADGSKGDKVDDTSALAVGDKFIVDYSVDDIKGINNFTFFVDYNAKVMKALQPFNKDVAVDTTKYVSYKADDTSYYLIDPMMVEKQIAMTPSADNKDFDGLGANGTLTAAELGRIKLAGVAGLQQQKGVSTDTTGILFSIVFEVTGKGDSTISLSGVNGGFLYSMPQSGEEEAPIIDIGEKPADVEVPIDQSVTGFPEYDYNNEDLGVKVSVVKQADSDKLDIDVDGTSVDKFDIDEANKTIDVTLVYGTDMAPIIADMIAKSTEEVKVEANGTDGVTVTKGDDSMTIKFTVSTVVPAMYPTFSYDANGVKITLDGVTAAKDAVTGDNVKSFKANDASFMIDVVLIKDATVTIAALVDDIVSKSTEDVTITKTSDGNGVVIVSGDNSATIKFSVDTGAEEVKHVFEVGDQTITFENGNVTVSKGKVKQSTEDTKKFYVPIDFDRYEGNVDATKFTGDGVTYDATKNVVTITSGADTYTLEIVLIGDYNGDGFVNANDAVQIVSAKNKAKEFSEREEFVSDVDVNDAVNANDAVDILSYKNKAGFVLGFWK